MSRRRTHGRLLPAEPAREHPLLTDGIYVAGPWNPGACMGWGLPRPEPHLWGFLPPTAFLYLGPLTAPDGTVYPGRPFLEQVRDIEQSAGLVPSHAANEAVH